MRQIRRLLLATGMASLALLPSAVLASSLTEYVTGSEYAVGTCSLGQTGSFAGYGSATPGGRGNAIFATTICHSPLGNTSGSIEPGGSFALYLGSITLVGAYTGGSVGPGVVSPLFKGSTYFCKEAFPVTALLGPATNVPAGATNITSTGSGATGTLTHIGVFTAGGGCYALVATITGVATLTY